MTPYEDGLPAVEDLLDETVRFTREILADLLVAKILPNKINSSLMEMSVYCLSEGTKSNAFMMELLSGQNHTFVERAPYNASHASIVGCFQPVLKAMLDDAGYRFARETKYGDYRDDDYGLGGCRSVMSICDFGITCKTTPEKLRRALLVEDSRLAAYCKQALKAEFDSMAEFKQEAQKRGMDISNDFDPEKLIAALKDQGMPSGALHHKTHASRKLH